MIALSDRPLAFVDIETTGLDPLIHEMIEIAVIREDREPWVTKIAPEKLYTASLKALEINHYSAEAWKDAPRMVRVISEIQTLLSDCVVVAHNAGFDSSFILKHLREHRVVKGISHHWLDTATLAYHLLVPRGLESLSLAAICDFLEISNTGAHSALIDAERCQKVFQKLVNLPTEESMISGA
ncbi:hypothetical protein CMI47_20180 [Candidatus Pacearchaeota archaeon]|nr:hypothetical protein [Candidatus Pacearchaeota archaeon]|tara:strand:- start:304 stop:852 length:549 start_codon:yes stop_codon:yes gene_type:complete